MRISLVSNYLQVWWTRGPAVLRQAIALVTLVCSETLAGRVPTLCVAEREIGSEKPEGKDIELEDKWKETRQKRKRSIS
ncbi:hypothetical protein EVAR_37298_1 [Eumeta japonica]|uniref:Uncharacterized protein n=1 Tax=Eumeta variegata TaxID=151549 RepID=A0A4C1X1J0_EUMVA|nr:hypothetical protein EVAR_37298_1 [Eumeta japonica]